MLHLLAPLPSQKVGAGFCLGPGSLHLTLGSQRFPAICSQALNGCYGWPLKVAIGFAGGFFLNE